MKHKELDKYLGEKVVIHFKKSILPFGGRLYLYRPGFLGIGRVYVIQDFACYAFFSAREVKYVVVKE